MSRTARTGPRVDVSQQEWEDQQQKDWDWTAEPEEVWQEWNGVWYLWDGVNWIKPARFPDRISDYKTV